MSSGVDNFDPSIDQPIRLSDPLAIREGKAARAAKIRNTPWTDCGIVVKD
jgi:hypothetical protein